MTAGVRVLTRFHFSCSRRCAATIFEAVVGKAHEYHKPTNGSDNDTDKGAKLHACNGDITVVVIVMFKTTAICSGDVIWINTGGILVIGYFRITVATIVVQRARTGGDFEVAPPVDSLRSTVFHVLLDDIAIVPHQGIHASLNGVYIEMIGVCIRERDCLRIDGAGKLDRGAECAVIRIRRVRRRGRGGPPGRRW